MGARSVRRVIVIRREYKTKNESIMNMNKWAEDILASPKIPAIPIMTHPGIEMIGKKVIDAVKDGQVHADAIIALDKKYPSAAPTVIMDLTVEAEAFGAQIEFTEDDVPNVIGRLVSSREQVEALVVPELSAGRVPEYIKANRIVAETISDKPSFAGCIGPYSLAGRLYDMTEIMMAIYTEPETATMLLEKCTAFIKKYIAEIKRSGVAGVIIAEPAAGLLSNEDATTYSSKYIKEIVDELQSEDFMIVLHNCGNTGHCTESMVVTGAKALHFGNKIDLKGVFAQVPEDVIVMGNLDPVSIFKLATPQEVAQATRDLLDSCGEHKNFVISTGCDTPPDLPEENIIAFYSQIK